MKLDDLDKPFDNSLNFDVVDDLHVFMRNDPMFYRKQYYPTMCGISDRIEKMDSPEMVKLLMPMVDKAAKIYCKKFKLGKDDSDLIKLKDRQNLVKKISSEELPRIRKGDYK